MGTEPQQTQYPQQVQQPQKWQPSKHKQSIFILADDLTGSADTASCFRTETRHVRVGFAQSQPWDFTLESTVVQVYDSETRMSPVNEAKACIYEATRELVRRMEEPFYIYKKIDSTLRGHIGAEIEAALLGLNRLYAVLAPAFPGAHRTVKNGNLYINGTPVSETEFVRDPGSPIHKSHIASLLHETTNLPVDAIPLAIISKGRDALLQAIKSLPARQSIIVVDAEETEDLNMIANTLADATDILLCGSAGLAKSLASTWNNQPSTLDGNHQVQNSPISCDKVLVVVGSANPKSHKQLETLVGHLKIPCVTLSPKYLLDIQNNETSREIRQALTALNTMTALSTLSTRHVAALSLSDERIETSENLSERLVTALAKIAQVWYEQQTLGNNQFLSSDQNQSSNQIRIGMIATGGETALALCKALSAHAIWPQGEIEPGMPWSIVKTPRRTFALITKAGGFGEENSLLHAVKSVIDTDV
jgi:D-threonate/D-erythronate kinase